MKKVLLSFFLMFTILLSGCSCNRFDIDAYTSAVKNYENSYGFEYKLIVTTIEEGVNKITSAETNTTFEFTTTKEVKNFASTTKTYEIATSNVGANGDPELVYEISRYYVGNTGKFHTIIPSINKRDVEDITYEEKYNESSEFHLSNLIPIYSKENISNFNMEEDNDVGVGTYKAACPSTLTCSEEIITYKVIVNKDYYFDRIEFTVVNGKKSSTYVYTFTKYNDAAKVLFPSNLS